PLFLFLSSLLPPYFLSFPTRRSSDLLLLPTSFALLRVAVAAQYLLAYRTAILHRRKFARRARKRSADARSTRRRRRLCQHRWSPDRKSTRLNSSHGSISYAVFCLKKK